jgi:hypothetical protein
LSNGARVLMARADAHEIADACLRDDRDDRDDERNNAKRPHSDRS